MTAIVYAATLLLFGFLCCKILCANATCPDVKCSCAGKAISCPNVGFTQIPTFSTEDLNVEFLLLDYNQITTIPEKAFAQLPNLLLISIENNPLQSVHPLAFNDVNDKTMSNVNQLRLSSLNLQKNFTFNLTSIINQLPNLRRLEVSRLYVDKLESLFVHNTLTQIVLDDVGMIDIDPQAFQRATALSKLTITKNSWQRSNIATSLHKWLAPLQNLQELDMSSNELSGELDNLPSLPKLHTLKLERNRLTTISGAAVQGVKNTLRVLVLGFNVELKNFNAMLGTLQLLESLYLNSNREALTSLPSSLTQMSQLRHLNIDYTDLSSVGQNELPASLETLSMVSCTKMRHIDPLAFANTRSLKTLIVEEIDLNDIVEVNWKTLFSYTRNLNKLFLSPVEKATKTFNSSIWESVSIMTQMTDLSLANNRLEYVPDFIFQNLQMLQSLNLAGNYLTNLTSATFYGLSDLKKLILSGNKLNEFDNCTFAMLPLSVEVTLEDNPLQCVCSMRWLRVFLNNSTQLASLTCKIRSDTLIWSQLNADQFCSPEESSKLSACQMKSPPTASPVSPPRYSLQVLALKLFLDKDNLPLVRIDIKFTQEISQCLRSWYITYGEERGPERLNTPSLNAQTTYVDISDGLRSGTKMIFCPVLILASGESYTHQSYCRNVSLKNPIEWKIFLIVGIIAISLILMLFFVTYMCVLRHRKLLVQTKLITPTYDNTVEEKDIYDDNELQDFVAPRSQDVKLHEENNTTRFSRSTTNQYKSTPQLFNDNLRNDMSRGALASSTLSLHSGYFQNKRPIERNNGYGQQRYKKAQTLQVVQVAPRNDIGRSIANLQFRELPVTPRLTNSMNQIGCADDEYVSMVQANDRSMVDCRSGSDASEKSGKDDCYGYSTVIKCNSRVESESTRFSSTGIFKGDDHVDACMPLSIVTGSSSDLDHKGNSFEAIVLSSTADNDLSKEKESSDCYAFGYL